MVDWSGGDRRRGGIPGLPAFEPAESTASQNERLRRFYDRSARSYDRWMRWYDRVMLGDARRRICSRAAGRTLEVAIGTGLNLPFYPPDIELTAIDFSPEMIARSRRRADELGLRIDLQLGNAHQLDFPDESFDTVVSTLMMSTVPEEERAARELFRVLRPGGRLLLLDHVRSPGLAVRWIERAVEPLLVRFSGARLLRDPLDYLAGVGFVIERCDRSRGGIIEEIVARRRQ